MSQSAASPDHLEVAQTRSHALLAHQHFAGMQLRGIAALAAATVATVPIVIDDLNGEPLYHDYALTSGGTVAGTIRCAANRKLGSPVISISHAAPGWSPDAALRMATEALHKQRPTARVVGSQLVCYANPKIGIRLIFELSSGAGPESAIFDVSSGQPVGQSTDPDNQFTAYSLLASLPANEIASRRSQFLASEQQIATVIAPSAATMASPTLPLPPPHLLMRQGLVQLSPYCPGSGPGNSHYAQITDYFCVDASAQMLMEHYGWNYTQNQIAIAMDTSVANGGTTGAGLTTGFASLTHNSLPLTFDNGASRAQQFQDAMTEVDANRPLFTQVPHHYRVCMGYQENLLAIWSALGLGRMLYIFDPWPWNPDLCKPGAPYWESWATSPVMWFGIVHHA